MDSFIKNTLSSFSEDHDSPKSDHQPDHHRKQPSNSEYQPEHHRKQPSNSELLSSAKLVAEAAKATLGHESDKVDKGKVAGAAADLLEAAKHYGKLEEKSYGKYVDKAEDYLHKYHSKSSTTTTTSSGHTTTTTTTHHSETLTSHSHSRDDEKEEEEGADDGKHGGGYGEYFKMAEGFLKKH